MMLLSFQIVKMSFASNLYINNTQILVNVEKKRSEIFNYSNIQYISMFVSYMLLIIFTQCIYECICLCFFFFFLLLHNQIYSFLYFNISLVTFYKHYSFSSVQCDILHFQFNCHTIVLILAEIVTPILNACCYLLFCLYTIVIFLK